MDLRGSRDIVSENLCLPVPADWIPYMLSFETLEAWVWRPGGLDAWMLAGLEGLEVGGC